jgi:hypothetical protein
MDIIKSHLNQSSSNTAKITTIWILLNPCIKDYGKILSKLKLSVSIKYMILINH